MTKAEACLWKYVLRARQMKGYQFRRQRPVMDFIADFMCKELRLVIEVDGITHDNKLDRDKRRDDKLRQAGFYVFRCTDKEVLTNIEGVMRAIERVIEEIDPPPAPSKGGYRPLHPLNRRTMGRFPLQTGTIRKVPCQRATTAYKKSKLQE